MAEPGTSPGLSGRRALIAVAATLLVLVVAVALLVNRSDVERPSDDGSYAGGSSTSATPSANGQPSTSLSGGTSPRAGSGGTAETVAPSAMPSASPGTEFTPGTGQTVPLDLAPTLPAVGLEDTAEFGTGVSVRLVSVTRVRGEAALPGETAGRAVRVVVETENDSSKALDLSKARVVVRFGVTGVPAINLSTGSDPLTGYLAPGDQARGTYVAGLGKRNATRVRVEVTYSPQAPTVVLRGPLG